MATTLFPRENSAQVRVLLADTPKHVQTLKEVLETHAHVEGVTTLKEAVSLIDRVNLIACGVRFDDSRMYDLLTLAKGHFQTRDVPFMCYRDVDSAFGTSFLRSLESACFALGASEFVDLRKLKSQLGVQRAYERFRDILLALLPNER